MPIAASDLILHAALSRPEDETSTAGGAIDPDHRPTFNQLAANDTLEMVSANAGDTTQTVTVTGRNAAGEYVSEAKTLNGTTVVSFTTTLERVLKAVMSADAAGIVTIRRSSTGPTVSTIPVGERGFTANFIKSASESGAVTRYDKVHWLNNHGSLTLNDAAVELTADPEARIRIGVHTAKDDSATITNRQTAPGGVTFVDDSVSQAVPGNTLEAASSIGVWVEQALTGSDAPKKNTYTVQLSGTSV